MKRILRNRPSPAFVIAVIALAMAMGGTAYALTITGANVPDNSLTGRDIRDVKGGDIRNYSITGKDIGKDSLGRVPIKEERLDASKIGEVKLATEARTFGGLTPKRIEPFTLDTNGTRELSRNGPFLFTARCREAGGNQIAEIIVNTNASGAAIQGNTDDADLTTAETGVLASTAAAPGTPSFDEEADGLAIAADGTEVFTRDLYVGTSVLAQPNKCRFGGIFYVG